MSKSEEARNLITRGHRHRDDIERREQERRAVEDYFQGITADDVKDAIADFEYSDDLAGRWETAKVLIAYFRWCWRNGTGSAALDELVASFSKVALLRMAGADLMSGDEDDGEFLPTWRRPDVAFGLVKPNHRPPDDTQSRDISIAMLVELLHRDGVEDRKSRAACRFGVSSSVVTKAITLGNSDEVIEIYGKRFAHFSNDDLRFAVDYYLAGKLEKSTR